MQELLECAGVNDIRQTEMHIAEPLVPEPSCFEVEIEIEEMKRWKDIKHRVLLKLRQN
jgi:hypothetical protein